jgi:hypothetical protein
LLILGGKAQESFMRLALPVALSLALAAGTAFAATPDTASTPPPSGGAASSSDQSGSATTSDQSTPPAAPATDATPATPPASTPPADQTPAPGASSAGATGANSSATAPANFQAGQQVQDNTGASIGTISSITGTGAQQMAVINMNGQTFQVPTNRLGMNNGSAEINLTQAQIATMLHGQTTTTSH